MFKPSDLQRLEQELGFQLPEVYRQLVTTYPEELHRWPKLEGVTYPRKTAFLFDVETLLKARERVRRRLKKEWPEHGFVIGGDREGWWLIDASQTDPPVELVTPDYVLSGFDSLRELFDTVCADHAEALKKAEKLAKAGPKAKLKPEELLAEGRRLARPAVSLHPHPSKQPERGMARLRRPVQGTETAPPPPPGVDPQLRADYAAVWKGTGVVSPGEGPWQHWISVDARFLPQNPGGRTGVISLYEWQAPDARSGELLVVHDPSASLPESPDSEPLYGRRFDCMPDVDALFHFGSQRVQDWYDVSWVPDKGYYRSPVKEYLSVLDREHPFRGRTGAYAMMGGWSWCFTWEYGIDEEYPWHLLEQALTVLTIEDSEPWIEVFDDGTTFTALSRIT
jgi:hypothetical protein